MRSVRTTWPALLAASLLSACNFEGGRLTADTPSRGADNNPDIVASPVFLTVPYLQHPGPDRMTVMFEPVEPGLAVEYRPLGGTVFETALASKETVPVQIVPDPVHYFDRAALPLSLQTNVHKAVISGLQSNTTYEYRVLTAAGYSDTFRFKTWPEAGDGVERGRFIVISDTQSNNPAWLKSVAEEGVIDQECAGDVHRCVETIAGVIISGDIVSTGTNSPEWRDTFFNTAQALFNYIPILPAIGNHDYTLENYLTYFEVPDNGSTRHREEWYAIDYLNFRLLALQSNYNSNLFYDSMPAELEQLARPTVETLREQIPGFARLHEEQRAWFDARLADAEASEDIAYVFASIHHPCKSELWIPGESDITCHYKTELEKLSARRDTYSGHFFGHTHAYSRGQSRDVPHLWLNAASASGAIDDWGDYEQADYNEFESSWDEYGYVVFDFSTTGTPEIQVTRKAGGDDHENYADRFQDSRIRDELVIGGRNQAPETPQAIGPEATISRSAPLLEASEFVDPDGDAQRESHWQLSTTPGDYRSPLIDAWGNETRQQNMWFREDLQAGVSLRHWRVPYLPAGGPYCWRVRYRDARLAWSDFSAEACFRIEDVSDGESRLVNGGAEDGVTGWDVLEGEFESVASEDCGSATSAFEGGHFFAVGGVCGESSRYARARQRVDVRDAAVDIAAGRVLAVLQLSLKDFDRWDVPVAWLRALDAAGAELAQAKPVINQTGIWRELATSLALPALTASVEVELTGLRQQDADNNSYADNIRLHLVHHPAPAVAGATEPTLSTGNGMALHPKKDIDNR